MDVVLTVTWTTDHGFDLERHNLAFVWVLRNLLGGNALWLPSLRSCVICGGVFFVCRQLEGILLLGKSHRLEIIPVYK